MPSFIITLAAGINLTVSPARIEGAIVSYGISIANKHHGTVFPDHGHNAERPLVWRSTDNMDKYLVNLIGKMIESHYD